MMQCNGLASSFLAERQRRWRTGHQIKSEDFFALHPDARLDPAIAVAVIHQEYSLLVNSGAEPSSADFLARFPEFAGALVARFAEAAAGHGSAAKLAAPHLMGRYLLRRPLGESERGMTYKAFDPRRGRHVAVKVLRMRMKDVTSSALAAMQRDLPRLAHLRHPNVCQIYALRCRGDEPYLAREYISGFSLADWFRQREKANGIRRAITIIWKTAKGLAALHEAGLVHGNVRLGNILLDASCEPHLADPALIRQTAHGPSLNSKTYVALGPERLDPYRAPELSRCTPSSRSADVFALGVVAHRLLTGVTPDGNSLQYHRPELDPVLAGILGQAIARRCADRFPTAGEFSAALSRALKRKMYC